MKDSQIHEGISKGIDYLHKFATDNNYEMHGMIVMISEDGETTLHRIDTEGCDHDDDDHRI